MNPETTLPEVTSLQSLNSEGEDDDHEDKIKLKSVVIEEWLNYVLKLKEDEQLIPRRNLKRTD